MKRPEAVTPRVRAGAVIENLRGSLWVLPAVSVVAAIGLGSWLVGVELSDGSPLHHVVFSGGPEGARGVLQAVATSVITVTSLVFTLTVVALQLASTQFSPRLLRTFLRLPANQVVLSTFLATFVYSLVVLRAVRSTEPSFVPQVAVSVGFALVLMSVAALVYFINHITTEIRIDTLMSRVEHDTLTTIDAVHPESYDGQTAPLTAPGRGNDAVAIAASRSGIVQAVAGDTVRRAAENHDVMVVFACRVGDRVVRDGTLAWAWAPTRTAATAPDPALTTSVNRGVTIGQERTMQQDVSYGIRQLVDVAVKAMSPGINDPTTAVDAVGHLTSVMTVLVRRRLDPLLARDDAGTIRLALERPGFHDYLEQAISQIRRYAAAEPEVLLALLELCREVAEASPQGAYAAALRHHVRQVAAAAARCVEDPHDLRRVEEAAARVTAVIDGVGPPQIAGVQGDT